MKDHIVASFGPNAEYTRHSEGAFLRLKDGRILHIYSRFTGTDADDAPSDLVSLYSSDEGETWTEAVTTVSASRFGVQNVMSVSLMRMANDDVGLFFIVKEDNSAISHIWLARSNDEAASWYKYTQCTLNDRQGYYVLNNDRIERLASGRLLMPMAFHRGGYRSESDSYFFGLGEVCFLYSDDDGETWAESPDTICKPFNGTGTGLQEPGVIELRDGLLWASARTDKMFQSESFSFDGGLHWTVAQPSRFTSPESPMKIARNPANGDIVAVWNPIPNYNGRVRTRAGWGRTPIVYAISKDNGATWGEQRVIEDDPDCGYCYPSVFFTNDGAMLVSYCAGGPDDHICLARLTMKKLYL